MKIIDQKTGKRVVESSKLPDPTLKTTDPIKRNVEKSLDIEENSPMDPPDAYDETMAVDVKYDQMHAVLQKFKILG